jgi:hypothetical protein
MPTESPAPGSGRVDVRKDRLYSWIGNWIAFGLFLLLPIGLAVGARYAAFANGNIDDLSGDLALFGVLGAVLLVPLLAQVAIGPRHLARQGVEVGDRGIGFVRERRWWARGGTVFVPWQDLHLVTRSVGKGFLPQRTLEVHLERGDGVSDPVVRWATLVPAGRDWKGTTASRPRIVLTLNDPTHARIEEEIEAWRPTAAQRPRSAAPAPEAAPAPAAGSSVRRVEMRWQQAAGWIVTTATCVYLALGLAVLTVVAAVNGEYAGAGALLFLTVFFALVSRPLLRRVPRYTTVQGVELDGEGITLVQEPKGSFAGVRTRVPWSEVLSVGEDVRTVGRSEQYYVDVVTREALYGTDLPHWVALEGEKLRIKPNPRKHGELVRAFRAVRPDLLPGG